MYTRLWVSQEPSIWKEKNEMSSTDICEIDIDIDKDIDKDTDTDASVGAGSLLSWRY